jgi:polyisoprenyl-phosphate glycosyltransferase
VEDEASFIFLLPVFNDWRSVEKLLNNIDAQLESHGIVADVLLVDDGSTSTDDRPSALSPFRALRRVNLLELRRNLGHQRAIAVGLAYIEANLPCKAVIVMDSDGEDDPADVPRLLEKCKAEEFRKIIFAERTKRSERWRFRFFYSCYKALHHLLTGQRVRVGNFSIVPKSRLTNLVAVSEIWNHYSAAVFKSRLPFCSIPTERACRLDGKSQMKFVNLVIHGLSAISVNADIVGVRLLIASLVISFLALIGILAIVAIRLFTSLAIPGWATSAAGLLLIILLQFIMFSVVFCFFILNNRQATTFLPMRDYQYYVSAIKRLL